MAQKNYITKSNKSWGFPNWKKNCPAFTFKVLTAKQIPAFLPESLREKFNSGYLASSGTTMIYNDTQTDFYIGMFVGLRIDKGKIDEHQYVSVYNQNSGKLIFDGILQHASYEDRTTDLTKEQLQIILNSGLTSDIRTKRLPEILSGHLSYLAEKNIITGIEVTAMKAMEELMKEKLPLT